MINVNLNIPTIKYENNATKNYSTNRANLGVFEVYRYFLILLVCLTGNFLIGMLEHVKLGCSQLLRTASVAVCLGQPQLWLLVCFFIDSWAQITVTPCKSRSLNFHSVHKWPKLCALKTLPSRDIFNFSRGYKIDCICWSQSRSLSTFKWMICYSTTKLVTYVTLLLTHLCVL